MAEPPLSPHNECNVTLYKSYDNHMYTLFHAPFTTPPNPVHILSTSIFLGAKQLDSKILAPGHHSLASIFLPHPCLEPSYIACHFIFSFNKYEVQIAGAEV